MGLRLSDPINDLDNVDQFHEGLFVFAMCNAGMGLILGFLFKPISQYPCSPNGPTNNMPNNVHNETEKNQVKNLIANNCFALSALSLLAGMAMLYMPGTTQSSGKVEPWVDAAAYSAMIIFPMVTAFLACYYAWDLMKLLIFRTGAMSTLSL